MNTESNICLHKTQHNGILKSQHNDTSTLNIMPLRKMVIAALSVMAFSIMPLR